ncbi:hypothetical protein LCGC14_2137140 [marine sediment metagenome]|uniref:Uncharacterized protein n=1 Tax=marine sediment metagenome TaxID=412755 RepID=A0A0F9DZQ3_9ZZZZ
MARRRKRQLQDIPPRFGGLISTTPELQFQQNFPRGGGLAPAPKPLPKVLPELEEPEIPAPVKKKFSIDGKQVSKAEFQKVVQERKFVAEGGRRALTPEEAQVVSAGEAGKRERQQEILEREAARRGVSVEELPPEVQEAVTKQALVEGEGEGILQQIADAYTYVDTLGGMIPEEAQEQLIMGTLPVGPGGLLGVKQGKAVLNTAKVVTGARATQAWNGMLNVLKNKVFQKGAGWGALGYVWLTERKVGNIDSALSQVRESITLPVSLAAVNPTANVRIAFDQITDLEDDVNEYESMLQSKLIESSFNLGLTGRLLPVNQRIKKLRAAIELARGQVAKIEASGVVPTDEETIIMLDEINKILNTMEDPIKFLGVF